MMIDYYHLIQNFTSVALNFFFYTFVILLAGGLTVYAFVNWKIRLRLLRKKNRNAFKLIFYGWEVLFLPCLMNPLLFARCDFQSRKDAIYAVQC